MHKPKRLKFEIQNRAKNARTLTLNILFWLRFSRWQLTKHSRGIHNAWQFWFELALVFTAHAFRRVECVVHPLMRRYTLIDQGGS